MHLIAACAGLTLLWVPAVPAHADSQYNFDAVAAAYGIDSTIDNPSIPLGLTVEAAGPVAQAHLSSINQSDGFAAFPYPGDAVVGVPGLVKGALLPGFPIPAYPAYANSELGSSPAEVDFPGITLSASSDQHSTHTRATAGEAAIGSVATADVTEQDSGITATASTSIQAATLGNLLSLSGVQSTATAVLGPDGKVTTSSSLAIARITVAGLNLTLPTQTPDHPGLPIPIPGIPSFQLPFPAVPLPLGGLTLATPDIGFENGVFTITLPLLGNQTFSLPASTVLGALKAVGLDVSFQNAVKSANGIVGSNLTIKTVLPAPPSNKFFNGATPVSFTIGRASASFASASVNPPTTGGLLPPPPVTSGFGGGTVDTSGTAATTVSQPAGAGLGNLGGATGGQATGAPSVTNTQPSRLQTLALERRLFSSLAPLYLALVGIGIAGTLAGQFLRYQGVRSSWKS